MSGIRNQGVHRAANLDEKHLVISLSDLAISQANAFAFKFTPGYKFKVARVASYCRTKAGTVTARVRIGTTNVVAAAAFTAATEVAAALSTVAGATIGKLTTSQLTVDYTTDGSGALVDGFLVITIRPWPRNGELGPVS